MSGWQASFGGCCKLAWVLPCDRCSPQGNGRKSRCRRPHRGAPHRRAQAASLHSAHWVGSVSQDVFVVGHRIHVLAGFAGPRPRVRRRAGRGQRRRAVPLAPLLDLPIGFRARLRQRDDEQLPILVSEKDRLTPVAAIHDVINRAGILDSQLAGHAGRVALAPSCVNIKNRPLYRFGCGVSTTR